MRHPFVRRCESSTGRYIKSVSVLQGVTIVKKYVVWLLAALFCFTELFSYADITYLGLESSQGNDIIYLNNGKQIKGAVVGRTPQSVIIKTYNVDSDVSKNQIISKSVFSGYLITYSADSIDKVEFRPENIYKRTVIGCLWFSAGFVLISRLAMVFFHNSGG